MRPALSAAAMVLASSPAAAEAPGEITELAVELAYELCPAYIDGELQIDSPELATLGFTGPVTHMSHPRLGPVEMLELQRGDGSLTFAISPESVFCQVNIHGTASAAALAELRKGLTSLDYDFKADAGNTYNNGNIVGVETWNAEIDEESLLVVQFVAASGPTAQMAGFQIMLMENPLGPAL